MQTGCRAQLNVFGLSLLQPLRVAGTTADGLLEDDAAVKMSGEVTYTQGFGQTGSQVCPDTQACLVDLDLHEAQQATCPDAGPALGISGVAGAGEAVASKKHNGCKSDLEIALKMVVVSFTDTSLRRLSHGKADSSRRYTDTHRV